MANRIVARSLEKSFKSLEPKIVGALRRLFLFKKIKNSHLEVFLVDSKIMNKNVLSFEPPKSFPHPDIKQRKLGEIYLNPDYIRKELLEIVPPLAGSRFQKLPKKGGGKNFKLEIPTKLAYMLIHGFLHLLGYDHKRKSDTIKMKKEEGRLLRKLEIHV